MTRLFCAVVRRSGTGVALRRSKAMALHAAIALCREFNRASQDYTWNAEEAYPDAYHDVKHLPVQLQPTKG